MLAERETIRKEMNGIKEMLNGKVTERFQKCGKEKCICKTEGHKGHGPHYSLSYFDENNKLSVRNFQPGKELKEIEQKIENYHKYKALNKKYISLSTEISLIKAEPTTKGKESDEVKKNLKRK